ncbi:UNVERIFIED_CONTAM: hypothetical protein RMT77_008585 [Armadillidium vulgare]
MYFTRSNKLLVILIVVTYFAQKAKTQRTQNYSREPNYRPRTSGRILSGGPKSRINAIELKISLGTIIGTIEQSDRLAASPLADGRRFYAFRGIPYAKPPVGSLRWADPELFDGPWERDRLDATKFKSFCPQYDHDKNSVLGNEDCLYLNIFTPYLPGVDQQNVRLPVLVFIHGGAYTRGASSSHGPERLMREDIIVVTLNYRLGVLGLMSTNDQEFPGNYAALDQVTALHWIRRYIAEFGGDFNAITLGGFSAGASYVHLHTLSPLSEGLFQRALIMSGAANCIWSIQKNPWEVAMQFGRDLDCPTSSSYDLKQCLLLKDTETLLKTQAKRSRYVYWPFEYRPVVDKGLRESPFLPAAVEDLMRAPITSPVPVMIGGTPEEGILFSLTAILFSDESSNPQYVYDNAVSYLFESLWPNETSRDYISKNIQSYYFSEYSKKDINILTTEMTDALTDLFFTSCIWDAAANIASMQMPVYTYLMTHHKENTPSFAAPLYRLAQAAGITSPLLRSGVSHGDDVILLFKFPYTLGDMSTWDLQVSILLTSVIGSFIKTGNPRSRLISQYPSWEPIRAGQPVFWYRLSLSPTMIQKQFRYKERNMWRQTLPLMEATYESSEENYSWSIAFWITLAFLALLFFILIVIGIIFLRSKRSKEYPKGGATLRSQRPRPTSFNDVT